MAERARPFPERCSRPDGLYRVVHPAFVAGIVIEGGRVVAVAPILARRLAYWLRVATRIGD